MKEALIILMLTVSLIGCTEPNKERAQTATDPNADQSTGISSSGALFPVVPGGLGSGSEATSAHRGNGRGAEFNESSADYERLMALPPLEAGVGAKAVFPPDDRKKILDTTRYPESAQVMIALPDGRCSGALIGKDLVITAGHCVHTGGSSGAWKTSATVYPGRNGRLAPFGWCSATKFYSVLGWTRDQDPVYDFGAIKLNCDIGNQAGWLGTFWQAASLVGKSARISSYPGDKPLEQWGHTDQVRSETATQTRYLVDTMPGNSGSGVYAVTDAPANCGGPCIHTAHAYGSSSTNSGTRITQALFENIRRWLADPK